MDVGYITIEGAATITFHHVDQWHSTVLHLLLGDGGVGNQHRGFDGVWFHYCGTMYQCLPRLIDRGVMELEDDSNG